MNLQESIRRILREESNIPRVILRRVTIDELDKIFERSLDENTEDYENPLAIMYGQPYKVFAKFVIDIMISELEGNFDIPYINDEDEYIEKYRKPLLRHYAPIIKDRYMDITSNNVDESILREEAEIPLKVKRRFDRLKELVNVVLDGSNPCDYSNIEHYFKGVLYDLETFLIVFEMEGMTNEEILSVVENYFYEDIRQYYINSLEDC